MEEGFLTPGGGASGRGDLVEAGSGLWGLDANGGEGLGEEGRVEGRWRGRGKCVGEGQVVWDSPETEMEQPIKSGRIRSKSFIRSVWTHTSSGLHPPLLPVLVGRLWTD